MPCQVFISYRRDDSGEAAALLFNKLAGVFSGEELFMDRRSIETGDLWEEKIKKHLEEADIVLVLIGNEWLTVGADTFGVRRIDNEHDWVRKEIETALKLKKMIWSVLLDNANMPPATALPEPIKGLLNHQTFDIKVSPATGQGVGELASALKKTIDKKNSPDELREQLERILDPKYIITREIGRGEMFKVYLAKDTVLERNVTVRVVRDPKYNPEFIDTLRDAAGMVEYVPNCIDLYSAWIDREPHHVVMSYLESGTLREIIADNEGRGLSLKEVLDQLTGIGNALAIAHDAGITHCNIKPSNVIVGINREPYISPLCRFKKITETIIFNKLFNRINDNVAGSREDLCYLAPEIFDNTYIQEPKEKNEKIDQYMLGLLAYELLSGCIPDTATNLEDIRTLHAAAFKKLAPIVTIRKDCPVKLSDIIGRMTSIDPEQRYPTLKQVIQDIERISLDELEIARESYARCISSGTAGENGFFKTFYSELLRISDEAKDRFSGKAEQELQQQYDKLRESIFILFLFADGKMIDKYKEPNVLTRIAQKHNKYNYNISPPTYSAFVKALTNTVCGAPPFVPEPFDQQCKSSENDRNRIMRSWEKALQPGIQYMISRYWEPAS